MLTFLFCTIFATLEPAKPLNNAQMCGSFLFIYTPWLRLFHLAKVIQIHTKSHKHFGYDRLSIRFLRASCLWVKILFVWLSFPTLLIGECFYTNTKGKGTVFGHLKRIELSYNTPTMRVVTHSASYIQQHCTIQKKIFGYLDKK